MKAHAQLWPEGKEFIREVLIPTKYDPLPVMITYVVPPFDVVVDAWQNTDPLRAYPLFRQFIVDWDQEDKLTDKILKSFLVAFPGTDKAIYDGWAEYMKVMLATNETVYAISSQAIN